MATAQSRSQRVTGSGSRGRMLSRPSTADASATPRGARRSERLDLPLLRRQLSSPAPVEAALVRARPRRRGHACPWRRSLVPGAGRGRTSALVPRAKAALVPGAGRGRARPRCLDLPLLRRHAHASALPDAGGADEGRSPTRRPCCRWRRGRCRGRGRGMRSDAVVLEKQAKSTIMSRSSNR